MAAAAIAIRAATPSVPDPARMCKPLRIAGTRETVDVESDEEALAMPVMRSRFESSDIAEVKARWDLTFPGAQPLLSDAGDDFWYGQTFAGDETLQVVEQDVRASIAAQTDQLPFVTIGWASRGETETSDGLTTMSMSDPVYWSGIRPYDTVARRADVHSVTIMSDTFVDRSSNMLGRDFELPPATLAGAGPGTHLVPSPRRLLMLAGEVVGEQAVASPLIRAAALDTVIAAVFVIFHLEEPSGSRSAVPRAIRAALDYMDEHAGEAITVTDVAAHVGLSVRSLQDRFHSVLETTPTAYLRRLRLEGARADLLIGDRSFESVGAVAQRWGFRHLGRFSNDYSRVFGELPRQTLGS
jgi:AraC-like DNA-binding protein